MLVTKSCNSKSLFEHSGNVISLAVGKEPVGMAESHLPIRIIDEDVQLSDRNGHFYFYRWVAGVAVLFLSPLPDARLELKICGWDANALRRAITLFPLLTGTGQPEFIILHGSCAWRGAAGALAMGSLTNSWKASEGSLLT